MYLQEVSKSRLGSLFASISIHADEDIAEILRMIADTYGDVVDRLLPPSYTFVESDLVRGDDLVAEKEFNRSLGTPSFGTDLINIGSEPIERSRIGSGNPRSESDHLRELEVSMGFRSETLHPDITTSPLEYDSRSDQVDIFNDEGYVSDDEATIIRGYANQQLVGQTQLSQIDSGPLLPMGPANGDLVFEVSPSATPETTTPPVQKLRSLLKPPSSAHMHNIVRTQSDPNLQIVLDPTMRGLFMELEAPWIDIAGRQAPYEMTAFPNSSPILLEPWVTRHQSSWHWETSSSPNTVSFDDIPGLRRESQSIREVQRLVTISADAVGRAHHHWLRPCTACARKAVAEKKEKEFVMKRSKRAASIPDTNEAGGVYRRTVHWVKKQEERIKQH
ncbi:hypothetical protein MMC19_003221 [Ptychographa xylographoides]|nr:hypothetical protein [Ptychographa xylographoides]